MFPDYDYGQSNNTIEGFETSDIYWNIEQNEARGEPEPEFVMGGYIYFTKGSYDPTTGSLRLQPADIPPAEFSGLMGDC